MNIQPYNDGVVITFNLVSLFEDLFTLVFKIIRQCKDNGQINILDLYHDKKDVVHISIECPNNYTPKFIELITSQLTAEIQVLDKEDSSLKEKLLTEFHELISE